MTDRGAARWPLLVACAASFVYLASLGNGFALDDIPLVRDNVDIRSLEGIPRLFTLPYWNVGEQAGVYRPVVMASFALNRAVTGEDPWGFHLVNVLLHALVAALVWMAARRAGVHFGTAFLAGLIFAVHPVHVEAVANVAGRGELLAAAGVLGAWLAHGRGRYVLAAALYFGALLSKETAVLAPLLFLADDALRGREGSSTPRGPGWRAWAGFAVALGAALALRAGALGGFRGVENAIFLDNPAAFAGTLPRVATALWTLALHVKLFVWPATLVSDYSFDAIPVVRGLTDVRLWAGLAVTGAWAGSLLSCWRGGRRTVFLGLAVAALFVLPSANLLIPTGSAIFAERFSYLPSVGPCLIVGHLGAAFAAKARWPRDARLRAIAVIAAAAVVTAALGTKAALRSVAWKDNLTLAVGDAVAQPRSAKLQAGAGIALHAAGRDGEAEEHLRRAVAIWPEYAQARYNLAALLAQRGARQEAIVELRTSVATGVRNPLPWDLLVSLLVDSDRLEEALAVCARAYDVVRDEPSVARRCAALAREVESRSATTTAGSPEAR